ncbi:MAG: ornithine decarboxylase [Frankiaceae bacterium]|nr:ornithine decarboxylase [Frankiaceae bacterium]
MPGLLLDHNGASARTRRAQLPPGWPATLAPDVLNAMTAETPFLVTDVASVRSRYHQFVVAFRGRVALHYAVKCNPSPSVLRALHEVGAGFEVASYHELTLAIAAGASASDVFYSNPVRPAAHVRSAAEAGLRYFVVDGPHELRKIAEHAPGSRVVARIRVDDGGSKFPLSAKFGAEPEVAYRLLAQAAPLGLVPAGLTFHVGSQSVDPTAWGRAVDQCGEVLVELDSRGIRLELLDIGGGFPATVGPDVPTLDDIAAPTLAAIDRLPVPVSRIVAEPGRGLVGDSAVLAATVIGCERRAGRMWVYLDVGAYNGLMEAAQTAGRWPFPLRTSRADDRTAGRLHCTLTGPTCDSSDTILVEADLPDTIAEGDRVYIGSAGAYSLSYVSAFNGFDSPLAVTVGA